MSLVLDSSATLAWFYSDETTPAIREVFELLLQGGAWVPSYWRLEVANILEMGIRRGRHDAAFRQATLTDLLSLPISIDPETDRRPWDSILQLAHLHRLTLYERGLPGIGTASRISTCHLGQPFARGRSQ